MVLPSKVITYRESSLSKFPCVLSILREHSISPNKLYKKVKSNFEDMGEFLEVLDCLYALGKIDIDEERGVLFYVA